MQTKIEIVFSKLFSKRILENKVVSTILYIVSKHVKSFKYNMELTLNNDI